MSQYVDAPTKTFETAGAIGQWIRVAHSGTGNVVAAAAVDVKGIGHMEYGALGATLRATVRLHNAEGTQKAIASEAITSGAEVFAAADGEVATTGTVSMGFAMHAVAADGDVVEIAVV